MRFCWWTLIFLAASPAVGQWGDHSASMMADFPPIPPLTMYDEILSFRDDVDRSVKAALPKADQATTVAELADKLVERWDSYGVYMDREHGHFPNMGRGRPYWIITTDEAADTVADRLGRVVEKYIRAHPQEILGDVRAEWEMLADSIGMPRTRIFGFQVVQLARLGGIARRHLETAYPDRIAEVRDAYIRYLWDAIQFYRQLHATWFDKHTMNVAKEDWIIHRIAGRCEDPEWQIGLSFTAIGIDTSNMDPMSDKFMHRIVVFDPACPETVDFVVPLRHFRRMERELNTRTAEEQQKILERYQKEAMERGRREARRPEDRPR